MSPPINHFHPVFGNNVKSNAIEMTWHCFKGHPKYSRYFNVTKIWEWITIKYINYTRVGNSKNVNIFLSNSIEIVVQYIF